MRVCVSRPRRVKQLWAAVTLCIWILPFQHPPLTYSGPAGTLHRHSSLRSMGSQILPAIYIEIILNNSVLPVQTMMTSSHGNAFLVIGHLWKESSGQVDNLHKGLVMRSFCVLFAVRLKKCCKNSPVTYHFRRHKTHVLPKTISVSGTRVGVRIPLSSIR